MTAKLNLNFAEALSAEELRELSEVALAEHEPLERTIYKAVRDFVAAKKLRRPLNSERAEAAA